MILTLFGTTTYNNQIIANIFKNPRYYYNLIKREFILRNYRVNGNKRPEQVAYELYGDPNLYWVLLLVNEIIDPLNGWIKSVNATQETSIYRYQWVGGPEQVDHHVDEIGRKWYDVIEHPVGTNNWYSKNAFGNPDRFVYRGTMVPVSITENEQDLNEAKRTIEVVNPADIRRFVDRMVKIIGDLNDSS